MKKSRSWIPLIVLLCLLGYLVVWPRLKSDMDTAPDVELALRDGSTAQLSDLRGSYVLLDFWASWCAPCIKDIPKIKRLDETYAGDDFQVVSIALEKKADRWERALDKYGMDWKYNALDQAAFVRLSAAAAAYGVTEIPATFLIDPQGNILGRNMSLEEISALLDDKL